MNRFLFLTIVALAAVAGFLIGRTTGDGTRAGRTSGMSERAPSRRIVELPAEEVVTLREQAGNTADLRAENERLEAEVRRLERELEPKIGERRPDGTLVGGGRWSDSFAHAATGFLDSMLVMFLREAKLTPEQEKRVRTELNMRIGLALGFTADYTNGDLTADQLYEQADASYADGLKVVYGLLDEDQVKVYKRFETSVKSFMHNQVVHQELAALKQELGLDSEQSKKIQEIVGERYKRVQANTPVPLPNVLFKPIRRNHDKAIYDETASAIRKFLRPEQAAAYDRIEAKAPTAPLVHRSMLVPKVRR